MATRCKPLLDSGCPAITRLKSVEQIVGRERRERVSHQELAGDAWSQLTELQQQILMVHAKLDQLAAAALHGNRTKRLLLRRC